MVLPDGVSEGSNEGVAVAGQWSFPDGCRTDSCIYAASWQLDANSDVISFKIRAKQQPDKWTGIAFARGKTMVGDNASKSNRLGCIDHTYQS